MHGMKCKTRACIAGKIENAANVYLWCDKGISNEDIPLKSHFRASPDASAFVIVSLVQSGGSVSCVCRRDVFHVRHVSASSRK
jgi:hypothetical protein